MFEYGFSEWKDYSLFLMNRPDGHPGKPKIDHTIIIRTVNEVRMLQRTVKGMQCRAIYQYEEAWNSRLC